MVRKVHQTLLPRTNCLISPLVAIASIVSYCYSKFQLDCFLGGLKKEEEEKSQIFCESESEKTHAGATLQPEHQPDAAAVRK